MTIEDPVRSYFTCLDTEDWDAMRELWHVDAELRAVGARPRQGIDEVIEYFAALFAPWPQHRDAPTRVLTSGHTVVAEVQFTGTTADGRDVTFDAVDVFDIEDGQIRRLSNWYDVAYARRILSGSQLRT
ncbi:MAG: nuclear transport factor 2 family protein [Terriglobales bacterium]